MPSIYSASKSSHACAIWRTRDRGSGKDIASRLQGSGGEFHGGAGGNLMLRKNGTRHGDFTAVY